MDNILKSTEKDSLRDRVCRTREKYTDVEVQYLPKGCAKHLMNEKVRTQCRTSMVEAATKPIRPKRKVKFLVENLSDPCRPKVPPYMTELPRSDVSVIFKARTRMLDVKNNFRGKYPNMKCRACNEEIETQEHVFTGCEKLHSDESTKIKLADLFDDNADITKMKDIANKIRRVINSIDNLSEL